jgi:type I restriction enzyme S subunit
MDKPRKSDMRVSDVSELINERINPIRFGKLHFNYIEISDVDGTNNMVTAKLVHCAEAPSRARKLVAAGDVLISTVRPERKAIGVVPDDLNGAVCSTGIAVLRPKNISSLVLARLLQSDFVNAQLLRNNIGIAYPTIEESCLPGIVLPASQKFLDSFQDIANSIVQKRKELLQDQLKFDSQIASAITNWMED